MNIHRFPPQIREAETVWEREGISHTHYAFKEAIHDFHYANDPAASEYVRREQLKCAIANLNHAWLLAVTEQDKPSPELAKELYHELEQAAGVWEQG